MLTILRKKISPLISIMLIFVFITSACIGNTTSTDESVEDTPEPTDVPVSQHTPGVYDFEDNMLQEWEPRGEAFIEVAEGVASTGDYSLLVSNRAETWHGAYVDVADLVEPGKTYEISASVMLAEGQPDSRLILTMQRTPIEGDTVYEWIAPSLEDGVTNSAWVQLKGLYTFNADSSELHLYLESPDSDLVDFYIDDITIIALPEQAELPIQTDIPSVAKSFEDSFLIGAALEPDQLENQRHVDLFEYHFNSITPENAMKPISVQPAEGEWAWQNADILVEYAQETGVPIHGHTLVWHQQVGEWMFEDAEGNPLEPSPESKALVLARLETHIRAIVERYNGVVNVWDVVNEVVDSNQDDCMRRSPWYALTGMDYIITAFDIAHEVDPDAVLIINDYGTTDPGKRACIYNLVKDLQDQGVPIDGIGMQMHVNVNNPSISAIDETIKTFAELGEVHITELDMSVYTNDTDSYESVSNDLLVLQGYRYRDIFEVLRENADLINSVTFWGMGDDHTWLKYTPTTRLNLPLLFDENLQAKPAFWGVINPAQLPVLIQEQEVPKGSPVVDGIAEVVWATKPWQTLTLSDDLSIGFQTRWDASNLYLFLNLGEVSLDELVVDIYIDKNNNKTVAYGEDDVHYTITSGSCQDCEGIEMMAAASDAGNTVELSIPLGQEYAIEQQIGFDLRITSVADPSNKAAWNDTTFTQNSSTSQFGTLLLVDAPRVTQAIYGTPVIDGVMDDIWNDAVEEQTTVWVVGESGSTAVARTIWDEEYLYVFAVVTDDFLTKVASNAYEQDSFEVFIDQNNAKTTTYQPDDGQYRINFDNEATFNGGANADVLTSATTVTETGYIVELAIKFDYIQPEPGMIIGFDFQVNNDVEGDGVRDSVVLWNDPTHQSYQNTSQIGLLMFTK
ncbi:MAG: endo-1,4-beta-xylanase [Anaerolineales bacterium]|nr:endo-1,4-beta-xylanase [Anaerolineales bacterium]